MWLAGGGKGLEDLSHRWRVTTVSTCGCTASASNQVRTPHTPLYHLWVKVNDTTYEVLLTSLLE